MTGTVITRGGGGKKRNKTGRVNKTKKIPPRQSNMKSICT